MTMVISIIPLVAMMLKVNQDETFVPFMISIWHFYLFFFIRYHIAFLTTDMFSAAFFSPEMLAVQIRGKAQE